MSGSQIQAGRTYRLSPPDRTGWMFGLSLVQLLVVAIGVVSGTLLMVSVSVPVGLAVMVLLATFGAVKLRGTALVELAPQLVRYTGSRYAGSNVWVSRLPVVGGDERDAPRALAGLELLVVNAAELGVGQPGMVAVSHDVKASTVAATLRVSGRQFGLVEPGYGGSAARVAASTAGAVDSLGVELGRRVEDIGRQDNGHGLEG